MLYKEELTEYQHRPLLSNTKLYLSPNIRSISADMLAQKIEDFNYNQGRTLEDPDDNPNDDPNAESLVIDYSIDTEGQRDHLNHLTGISLDIIGIESDDTGFISLDDEAI